MRLVQLFKNKWKDFEMRYFKSADAANKESLKESIRTSSWQNPDDKSAEESSK
jgi:hypothetical protein